MAEEEEKQPIIIKKINKVAGGHHGGAWKVAYADFVTAMMALFIVLWILSASEETQDQIQAYFDDPGAFSFVTGKRAVATESGLKPIPGSVLGEMIGDGGGNIEDNDIDSDSQSLKQLMNESIRDSIEAAENLKSSAEELQDFIEGLINSTSGLSDFSESVKFTFTEDGLKIELVENNENLFFEVGSSKINPKGEKIIALLAKEIGKLPNSVEIQGHTDSRKYGNSKDYSNWDLSSDRANSTRKYMESKGLWNGQISVVAGYADKELVNKDNPFANENRRVTIYLKYIKSKDFLDQKKGMIEGLEEAIK
ncbi:MAG: flagellar motor protein MotB [Candidatus Kapaibacterium sp.]